MPSPTFAHSSSPAAALDNERLDNIESSIERMAKQVALLANSVGANNATMTRIQQIWDTRFENEVKRIDFVLAQTEGVTKEIDQFHADRATPEYQAAFTEVDPLVSVCIPTTNRADTLIDRCLHSLRQQTYRNLQIIVIGDHCTDDTAIRVAKLRDDRIEFQNLPHRGPYPPPGLDRWCVAGTNAHNVALSQCEGQFVTHLDDDDAAAPARIETLVRAAQEEKADFCWHPFWAEQPDDTWILLGNGKFEIGQITTSCVFYHRFFTRITWDVTAYRIGEPGDWNRLRKIKILRPKTLYVDRPLLHHYKEQNQPHFVPQDNETFLR
jgi:hypothetical protein